MSNRYNLLAARWVFEKAGVEFPDDAVDAYLDFNTAISGFCDTCAFEYTYVIAWVYRPDDASVRAEYNPGYRIDMSDVLEGMAEIDNSLAE